MCLVTCVHACVWSPPAWSASARSAGLCGLLERRGCDFSEFTIHTPIRDRSRPSSDFSDARPQIFRIPRARACARGKIVSFFGLLYFFLDSIIAHLGSRVPLIFFCLCVCSFFWFCSKHSERRQYEKNGVGETVHLCTRITRRDANEGARRSSHRNSAFTTCSTLRLRMSR